MQNNNIIILTINGINKCEQKQLVKMLNKIQHDSISFDLIVLEFFIKKILCDVYNKQEYQEIIHMENRTIINDIINLLNFLNEGENND